MKKLLLFLFLAVSALTAGAQVYVGGRLNFWRNWKDGANQTQVSIIPEVGYNLSEKWAIGTTIGYYHQYYQGTTLNGCGAVPYVRYTYVKFGNVNLFLDGLFAFATYKEKGTSGSQNAWKIGIRPGVSVSLTKQLNFVADIGFLGYRTSDDAALEKIIGKNGFGVDLDGNNLEFGLYYNF